MEKFGRTGDKENSLDRCKKERDERCQEAGLLVLVQVEIQQNSGHQHRYCNGQSISSFHPSRGLEEQDYARTGDPQQGVQGRNVPLPDRRPRIDDLHPRQ